jgi:L-alanine-DL-glutamate epimerase-like enolase superfamily enzyme
MPRIANIESALYRIPLPVTLSDSTHGEIAAFELITCRIRDADGAEGVGYTYTVGRNGGATADILKREIPPLVEGREAENTEAIWHHVCGRCIMADVAAPRCWRSPRSTSRYGI